MLVETSPPAPSGFLEIRLITPATAKFPQSADPPPRTTSTRSMETKGTLNHWIVE